MAQVAYITGADRGLGLALAAEFLRNGYRVFAGSFLPEVPDLRSLSETYGAFLSVVPLDVTDAESVSRAADAIRTGVDHLNVLINNAGTAVDRSRTIMDEFNFPDMQRIMEVNAFGPLRVTRSVIELLLNGNPRVLINISSIAGSVGTVTRKNQYAYTMSKTALNMQSKLIRNDLGPQGLSVYAVHPGAMPTLILGDPEITKNAPVTTEESARGIFALSERPWNENGSMYVDYLGNEISW